MSLTYVLGCQKKNDLECNYKLVCLQVECPTLLRRQVGATCLGCLAVLMGWDWPQNTMSCWSASPRRGGTLSSAGGTRTRGSPTSNTSAVNIFSAGSEHSLIQSSVLLHVVCLTYGCPATFRCKQKKKSRTKKMMQIIPHSTKERAQHNFGWPGCAKRSTVLVSWPWTCCMTFDRS